MTERKKPEMGDKNRISPIFLFIVSSIFFLFGVYFLLQFVVFPLSVLLIPDSTWLLLLIVGFFQWPFVFPLIYSSLLAFGNEEVDWIWVHLAYIVTILYVVGLAFLFDNIIPSDYEPFRSVTLPFIIFAVTIQILSRTRIGQKLKGISKPREPTLGNSMELSRLGAKADD